MCKIGLDQVGIVWVRPLEASSWLLISRQTTNALDNLHVPHCVLLGSVTMLQLLRREGLEAQSIIRKMQTTPGKDLVGQKVVEPFLS